jgi:phage protein D
MSAITFDPLKFVERLEKAGASRELASALAEAQKEAFAEALETSLATKADMGDVKLELAHMDSKMDKLSWMMGILIALAIANFAKQFF